MFCFTKSCILRLRSIIAAATVAGAALAVAGCGDNEDQEGGAAVPSFEHLDSFEALYEVSLRQTRPGAGIAGYSGLMALSWVKECDGFRTNQSIVADLTTVDGMVVLSEYSASTWEDAAQTMFRFFQTTKTNGHLIQDVAGRAERPAWGDEGVIVYVKPEERQERLGADVMFPSMYTGGLMAAARKGSRLYRAPLFDGADEDIRFDAVASIGKRQRYKPADAEISKGDDTEETDKESGDNPGYEEVLSSRTYWPVQLSYYAEDATEGLPQFQLSMKMFDNGVGTDMVLDYETFVLDAKLEELKVLDEPVCDKR